MSIVKIDYSKEIGNIKVMHAVNNGPSVAGKDQKRGNEISYRAARIPYARVHDAAFFAGYGGEHTVDVHAIFPNFNADVNDPDASRHDGSCEQSKFLSEPNDLHSPMLHRYSDACHAVADEGHSSPAHPSRANVHIHLRAW